MKIVEDGVERELTPTEELEFAASVAKPLTISKLEKHTQIERERDAERWADITTLGHTWQADAATQQTLASAILLAQAGVYTPSIWRDRDNVNVTVTLTDLVTLAGVMAAQTKAAYDRSWERKAALAAATTPEEVEAV